jgi:hypothetical protein
VPADMRPVFEEFLKQSCELRIDFESNRGAESQDRFTMTDGAYFT